MIFKEFKISIFKEGGGPKNTNDTVYMDIQMPI